MRTFVSILFLFACVLPSAAVVSGDDFNADANAAIATLQQWNNANGLWTTTGWWNAANCVDALELGVETGYASNYLSAISNTFNLNDGTNFLNSYYDDEGWWTEAWIRAYDLTGNTQFLTAAKVIFTNVTGGWDSECGGGVWWNKTKTYKNAIPNELFLLNAIRLHQRTPGDSGTGSFFYWATNEWNWFSNSGMINGSHLINDGLNSNTCANNGETTWTYNQGVVLAGLADLYKSTGNSNYLAEAETLANASTTKLASSAGVLQEPCETDGGCGGGDVPEFKGIFARHLACLYDTDHKAAYGNFLYTNAHSIWSNDRNSSNQLGLKWTGSFDSADAARQNSAIMALTAMAEPVTALLPFAKGSGDMAFNHSVGQAAGTLAWSCGPATPSGLMQYGPYLASLSAGTHVVHFRLTVESVTNLSATLASLVVLSQGNLVTQSNVTWNAFAQAGTAQDFPVNFTNTASGNVLEFRIVWIQNSPGPTLTASDVTVDAAHNWTAANLAHGVGRLDAWNGWEADPIRDIASGYLTEGPGTAELASGAFSANFELKVDNFNWDNSAIATLSVVNTDSNMVVASRTLTRGEFPNVLYHSFPLNFTAVAGTHYDFRTYWNYASNAPRLTQRSVVVAPAATASYQPVPLTSASYNEDMVIESSAPAVPNGSYTTASMDAGATNTGNGWYAQGYDSSAPATGLPPAGSIITNETDSDHVYALPNSYSSANAALIDSSHTATLVPAIPAAYSALSFLGAAGHGPVTVDVSLRHGNGTSESGVLVFPDWFNNAPVVFDTEGRVDVVSGAFNTVNGNNPNLYAEDLALTNTSSPVTQINLLWDSRNTAGVAAVFAVSGLPPLGSVSNVLISPSLEAEYVGTTASFSVTAQGTAPFNYQWILNDSPVANATNSAIILSNLASGNAGSYSCMVSNNGATAVSGSAILIVLPLPVLQFTYSTGVLTLTWTNGILLQSTNVSGPWTTNYAANSPWNIIPSNASAFYQLEGQ